MRIILEEVLKLHPLNKGKVLAGGADLKRPIDLFGVLEAPDSFHFVKNNEFLMTTGYMFNDDPTLQCKVVKELYNRGVCALGIKIGRYVKEVSEDTLNFCNEHNFPLLYLPSEYGWYDFFSPLLYLMQAEPEYNKDLLNKMFDLSDKILGSNTFNEIIKYIYGTFKTPCYIHINYNNSEMSYPEKSYFDRIDIETILGEFHNDENQFIMNNIKRIRIGDASILVSSINHDRSRYGYIFLLEDHTALSMKNISLFQYIIVCLQFYTNNFLDTTRKFTTKQNLFLLQLIGEKNIDKQDMLYKSNELNIDLYSDYILSVSKQLPISQCKNIDQFYIFIENNINLKYKVLSAFDFDGNYIIFSPFDKNLPLPVTYKNTKLKIINIKKELEKFFNNSAKFSFGIGNCHSSIEGIRKCYLEALRAFDSYSKFFNNDFIIHFKDLGMYSILSNPSIKEDMEVFAAGYLNPILEFDKENNSELINTVKYFFECHRSFRSCAKEMNLHHNTIRYRLKKIEDLCNIDLSFENDLLELELSLKLLPFLDKSDLKAQEM